MIRIANITKSYGARTLFSELNYQFPEGERIALVGPNGVGKTTLMNIVCGLEEADGGKIGIPSGMKLGYLPQEPCLNAAPTIMEECQKARPEVLKLKAEIEAIHLKMETDYSEAVMHAYEEAESQFRQLGGYELESDAGSILHGLGFKTSDFNRSPKEFSGGWQMRLELGKLFLMKPDILVLDEPTNHLDLPSMVWVEKYLQSFQGTLIFISHDRSLLNRLSTVTLLLNSGRLWAFKGNYDRLMQQWELLNADAEKRHVNLAKKKAQLQEFVDRFGAKASKAAQAKSKEKQIAKLGNEQNAILSIKKGPTVQFKFPEPPPVEKVILNVKDAEVGYPDLSLIDSLNLALEKDQRVAVIGANGIGKSTLLKSLASVIPLLSGSVNLSGRARLAYFAQDQLDVFDSSLTIMQNLTQYANVSERDARGILGSFLFSGDDAFKEFGVLSGGEKNRVGLAGVVALNPNLMLLDEPTNHLDMDSTDQLIETLKGYKGALILVSHNRQVIEALCPQALVIEKNKHRFEHIYKGMDFNTLFESEKVEDKKSSGSGLAREGGDPSKTKKSAGRTRNKHEQKKIKRLEANIKSIQAEIDVCQKILEDPKRDHHDLAKAQAQQQDFQGQLDSLEEAWLQLQD